MIDLTARLVAAYLKSNPLAASGVPDLVRSIYSALAATMSPTSGPVGQQQPFVSVKKSITSDAIICLECGKAQQMLKRHLMTAHGLSVDEYRVKWSLGADYPMVAPNYSERRSQLAIKSGLGQKKVVDAGETASGGGRGSRNIGTPRHGGQNGLGNDVARQS